MRCSRSRLKNNYFALRQGRTYSESAVYTRVHEHRGTSPNTVLKQKSIFETTSSTLKVVFLSLSIVLFALSAGCSKKQSCAKDGAPRQVPKHLGRIPNAVPRVEPLSRYGNRFKNSNSYVALNKRYSVMPTSRGYHAEGLASWYGTKFQGRKTSSGEPYNMYAMTAAHRTLPLPTFAKVTNLENGKSIVVKVNDRGPFHNNRLIDLSYVAAHKLGILGRGTGRVRVESVDPRDHAGFVPRGKALFSKRVAQVETLEYRPKHQPGLPPQTHPSAQSSKLYLQIGAFNQKNLADDLAKKLDQFSAPSQVAENSNKNKPRYRVIMGPFRNRTEAKRLAQQLAEADFPVPVVVTD